LACAAGPARRRRVVPGRQCLALLGTLACLIVEMAHRGRGQEMTQAWAGRMAAEKYELGQRMEKLQNFVFTPEFEQLPKIECDDLLEQLDHMQAYHTVLQRRYNRSGSSPTDA
jgi:hypothetical protein